MFSGLLGKYRAVVISIAMFIILDAGVLVLNFYISSQLAEDASNVNLAGRQRMLSQKTAKALLDYQDLEVNSSKASADAALDELRKAVALFDSTLNAFANGGDIKGASGEQLFLKPVSTSVSRAAVDKSLAIWKPLKQDFDVLFASEAGSDKHKSVLQKIVGQERSVNLSLLSLMNDLTVDLEGVARQKSETLRMIQAGAITLAVLNFLLILFHFIGQLRRSDAETEKARNETAEILRTVREGLLLLDRDMIIGSQYSGSISDIFGQQEFAGMSFRTLLKSLVVESDMKTAEEYIKLLLNGSVKENLVASLNPLSDIEVSLPDRSGGYQVKHLSFRFNRAIEDGQIRHILVTVLDITELVALRAELERASQNSGMQISALKELLHVDKEALVIFLRESESSLAAINDILKERTTGAHDYHDKIRSAFRIMHRIKGDASGLNLPQIVQAAHGFEEQLRVLEGQEKLRGGDFLPLTLALNEFFRLIGDMKDILDAFSSPVANLRDAAKRPGPAQLDVAMLERLASRIAVEQEKEVKLIIDAPAFELIPTGQRKVVQDCIVQLVRNSVVHGIEPRDERILYGKEGAGEIRISLHQDNGQIRVSVRDDGRGISIDKVRERAVQRGMYSQDDIDSMQPTRIISLIFEPGFSTSDKADEHSGRGVGMDMVKSAIQQLNGRIRIANRPSRYCDISFVIPGEADAYPVAEAV